MRTVTGAGRAGRAHVAVVPVGSGPGAGGGGGGGGRPASTGSSPSTTCSGSGATPSTASGGRRWNCSTTTAAVAAATSRIMVGTLVARATLRPAGTLRAAFDTLARIAPGRIIAGLGAGDDESLPEDTAFGVIPDALLPTRPARSRWRPPGHPGAGREAAGPAGAPSTRTGAGSSGATGWPAWRPPSPPSPAGATRSGSPGRLRRRCGWRRRPTAGTRGAARPAGSPSPPARSGTSWSGPAGPGRLSP